MRRSSKGSGEAAAKKAKEARSSSPTAVDNVIDELLLIEKRCRRGVALLEDDFAKSAMDSIDKVCEQFQRSWSGSWIGYQSKIY